MTRDTGPDLDKRTAGLEAPGRALWSRVTGAGELGPMQAALLLEACRIVDRLDRLDDELRGRGDWLRIEPADDGEPVTYVVVVDRALSEARQQATALKQIAGELRQADRPAKPGRTGTGTAAAAVAGAGGDASGKGAGLGDLTARILARSQQTTG